eukprot:2483274-Rhodomonas_salina.2
MSRLPDVAVKTTVYKFASVPRHTVHWQHWLLLESFYSQSVTMYIALWHALASMLVSIMETQVEGFHPYTFWAEWASDIVYSITCETKDIMAALTALVATLLQKGSSEDAIQTSATSVSTVTFALKDANLVNTEAYGQASLHTAAVHQFLYQAVLFP